VIPKPKPRVLERAEKRAEKIRTLRELRIVIVRRDRSRCRACDRYCDPSAVDSLARGHVHHVEYRSRGGGHDPSNVCLLCAFCHAAVHARELGISGDANGTLRMYGRVKGRDGYWESIAHGFTLESDK
jgi:hypothetical protein